MNLFKFLLTKSCSVDYKEFPKEVLEEITKIRELSNASYCFHCNHELLGKDEEYFVVNTMQSSLVIMVGKEDLKSLVLKYQNL